MLTIAKLRLADFEKSERQNAETNANATRGKPTFGEALGKDASPETPVMRVQECQKAMDRAAKIVGMSRMTHPDLRNLFATRCIESEVDIPIVSRWLGHKDGGALAMKVYGHLRDQHSVVMAQKVTFSKPLPENVKHLPEQQDGQGQQ